MYPIRSKDNFLVFGAPIIEQPEIDEVVNCLKSGWLGTGPRVQQFENDIARYKNVSYAVAVNSCSAGIHISLLSAGVGPGDEVITTPLTFCATINAIIHVGATPVLADVERTSMNIDPIEVKKKITSKTKAIIPVHFAGRACHMDALVSLCKEHKLVLIEDCAHAIETTYKGKAAGTFGDFGCVSFYVTKNIVTGEGGMVFTHDKEFANRLKVSALHGMSHDAWKRFSDEGYKHYTVVEPGWKYNMTDMQAAIGIHQLNRIDDYWRRREEVWQLYNSAFADLPITLPAVPEKDTRHAYHLYTILVDEERAGLSRDAFLMKMHFHNIGTGVHYLSIPEHEYYKQQYGWKPEDTPVSTLIGRQTISLPLSAKLTDGDVCDVVDAVKSIVGEKRI